MWRRVAMRKRLCDSLLTRHSRMVLFTMVYILIIYIPLYRVATRRHTMLSTPNSLYIYPSLAWRPVAAASVATPTIWPEAGYPHAPSPDYHVKSVRNAVIALLERASREQLRDTHKTLHDCRGCKRMKAFEEMNDGASTLAAGATEVMQVDDVITSKSSLDCIDIEYVGTLIIKDTFSSS
ncbi:hypothetical protein EVAR_88673_1 [Eumeta japonica]|uniref:Uncharacterized protein n=1 Tax=Eumeta variegata TaxID=151549 RepID=A0A4C1Y7D7_EUMVA|nr:hypothetical protein EVAR_88673_1 [Eumeta japonica]